MSRTPAEPIRRGVRGRWDHRPCPVNAGPEAAPWGSGDPGPARFVCVRSVHAALRAPARRPRVGGRPHCQWVAETLAGAQEEHQSPDHKTRWAETLRCGSCPHGLCDPGQTSLSLSLHRLRWARGHLAAAEGGTRPPGGPPSAHTLLSLPDYFYRAWSKFRARAPVWAAQDWGGCGLSASEIILASGDELMRPKPNGPAEASALGPM